MHGITMNARSNAGLSGWPVSANNDTDNQYTFSPLHEACMHDSMLLFAVVKYLEQVQRVSPGTD